MSGMPVFRLSAPLAAFLALLLLAPEAARAQAPTDNRNQCGANSGSALSCTAAAYARGIAYWDQTNPVMLTIQGSTSASTVTITSEADNDVDNGITIRTSDDPTSSRTSAIRNIRLTVGGTGTVAIRQGTTTHGSSWYNGRGILVLQRDGDGATTMLDIKSGVTIGTEMAKMKNGGIEVRAFESDAGAVTVTNRAAIYSEADGLRPGGIHIDNAGSGATMLTNSGAIVSDARGIYVEDSGSAGAVTVTSSGTITSASTTNHEGIFAKTVGTGKDAAGANAGVSVTHSAGAISVATGGVGIKAIVGAARREAETGHADYVAPMNAGLAKVSVTGGSISARGAAIAAVNYEAGSVDVRVSEGVALTSTAQGGILAELTDAASTGSVTVANAGAVTAARDGIFAHKRGSAGAVSVTHSAGALVAKWIGIRARNAAATAGEVRVAVTGGSVTAEDRSKPAVSARQHGTGDVVVRVSSGAALTSTDDAGVYARIDHADNAAGRIVVTQSGAVLGGAGVRAEVLRASATGETRAAASRPLIDVTWTGTFSHGTTAAAGGAGGARFAASGSGGGSAAHRPIAAHEEGPRAETERATRYGTAAGIEAHAMDWRAAAKEVAKGDDPGAIADAAAQAALFDAGADAATKARAAAVLATFRAQLATSPGAIPDAGTVDANGDDTHTDEEITAYLKVDDPARRGFLREILAEHLSEGETAVLRAVVTDTGLDAALAGVPGASDDWKAAVRALLENRNVGDIRIAMNGGSIASRGDGIRAYYATPNAMNGAISVTIAAGSTVSGGMAGVYVANAGEMGSGAERILKQTVTVNGMVTGGSDAAVHLVGGGTLTVGETGKVHAGSSGVAILVNDPGRSEIVINGEVKGGMGGDAAVRLSGGGTVTIGVNGRVEANGATNAIQADSGRSEIEINGLVSGSSGGDAAVRLSGGTVTIGVNGRVDANGATNAIQADDTGGAVVSLKVEVAAPSLTPYRDEGDPAQERLTGKVVGAVDNKVLVLSTGMDGRTGKVTTVTLASDGTLDLSEFEERKREETDTIDCVVSENRRCRLYNALPSALLSMNGLPSYGERMAAARSAGGGWAWVESAAGKWKAARSTKDANVSYSRSRTGVRAGVDMAVGEDGRVGLSAHGLTGSAKMSGNGGKVGMTGVGLGANATTQSADGFYFDAQLAVTQYRTKLTSRTGATLKSGVKGTGYALALETGQSMAMGGDVSVTPRAGLAWSRVSLGKFMDMDDIAVAMKNAGSFTGSVGLGVESAPAGGPVLFGTLDVVQEFTKRTETRLPGTVLKSTAPGTSLRIGLGAAADLGDGAALRGSVGYETAGGGTNEFAGGLSLTASF